MRKILLFLCVLAGLLSYRGSQACVGKTLFIGVTNVPQELMLAEMVSIIVYERTGTSAQIVTYKDSKELYGAMRKGEVGVLIENADRALKLLNRPPQGNAKASYDQAKKEFRQGLQLVWLEPFGGSQYYAPVISLETINNLPALPKLLNKLGGMVDDSASARLLNAMKTDKDQKKVARDFLKAKKLI